MKSEMLKIAGVKSEKEFYKKYPTEAAFKKAHPKAFKKAEMGASMVKKQLEQLTDFGNPPKYFGGGPIATGPGMPGLNNFTGGDNNLWNTSNVDIIGNNMMQPAGYNSGGYKLDYSNPGTPQYGNVPIVNPNPGLDYGGLATSAMTALPGIIGGAQKLMGNVQKGKEAKRFAKVSQVVAQAATTRDTQPRIYVRPEDYQVTDPYSQGMAANGTEIQNTYNPGDLYSDLGYEPLNDSNIKQFKKGGVIQAGIGSSIGGVAGTAFGGPIGSAIGSTIGGMADRIIEGEQQAAINRSLQEGQGYLGQAAFQNSLQNGPFSASMENGGWMNPEYNPQVIARFGELTANDFYKASKEMRSGGSLSEDYVPPSAEALFTGKQMAFGGRLNVGPEGEAELISYNPISAQNGGSGEGRIFRGPSHDNQGIDTDYSGNRVEVEGGEPIYEKADQGGNIEGDNVSAQVLGNMKIEKFGAALLGDIDKKILGKRKLENLKFKTIGNDILKKEARVNKSENKAINLVNEADNTVMGKIQNQTARVIKDAATMEYKGLDAIKNNLANLQDIYHQRAQANGYTDTPKFIEDLKANKLKSKAAFGAKLETADYGTELPVDNTYLNDALSAMTAKGKALNQSRLNAIGTYGQVPGERLPVNQQEASPVYNITGAPDDNEFDWENLGYTAISNIAPFLRPGVEKIDPRQFASEQLALATNQLEPVYAQQLQFTPEDYAPNVPIQDQLNEIDMQVRAAQRQAGSNTAALAQIAATAAEQKNKVRGEAMRQNMANRMGVSSKNKDIARQTQAQNLQILAGQAEKQALAKSKTLDVAQRALASMTAKELQHATAAKELGIMKNLYGFEFTPSGVAYNVNAPHQFNMKGSTFARSNNASGQLESGYEDLYNAAGRRVGTRKSAKDETTTGKDGKKMTPRNSSIVKSLKNI